MASISIAEGHLINSRPLLYHKTSCKYAPQYENGPSTARGIWQRHLVPAALHFDANVRQPCRFERGGDGGPGEMQLRDFFVRPDANPKCSQGWKQKQHECSTGHVAPPSIDAPSATQKHWRLFQNIPVLIRNYTAKNFRHHESCADEATSFVIRLLWWSDEGSRSASQRELTPTERSGAGSSGCM